MLCKEHKSATATLLGLILLIFSSCSRTDESAAHMGSLCISIEQITITTSESTAKTKAPTANEYTITITDKDGQSVHSALYSATPIVLSTGDYTVTATAGTTQPLAFDSPCYGGSSSISINTGKASQCTITSQLANAIIAHPNYDTQLTAHLTSYYTQVSSGGTTLDITPEESRTLYVQAGQECTINLIGVNDLGANITRHISTFNTEAAQRYTTQMKLSPAQFTMPTQNAGLAWSNEFTITELTADDFQKGNFTSYADHITYEYSPNGVDQWSPVPKDGQAFRCTGVQSGTTYHLRARADMPNNLTIFSTNIVTLKTESPTQIPNSGFDTWHTQNIFNGGGGVWNAKIDAYHLCSSSEFNANTMWWTTSNGRSTIKDYSSESTHYKSYAGIQNSGGAAEIVTIGLKGKTERNNRTDRRVIGEVAIGTNNSDKSINHGKEFAVRPTALKFSYKYAPHNGDTAQSEVNIWGMVDGELAIIGSGSFSQSSTISDFTTATINIDYQRSDIKATQLTASFRSGNRDGADAVYESRGSYGISPWKFDRFIGSKLTIDNVELIYAK